MVVGAILGDLRTGIMVGAAMQLVYIALVTPGGTVSADVRAVSYIGIPLAMVALKAYGLDPAASDGVSLATGFGVLVGTVGTVLFYLTATMNLLWQGIGWNAIDKGNYKQILPRQHGLSLGFASALFLHSGIDHVPFGSTGCRCHQNVPANGRSGDENNFHSRIIASGCRGCDLVETDLS